MTPEQKLDALGLVLPPAPDPLAQHRPVKRVGNMLYLSGQVPRNGDGSLVAGRMSQDTPVDDGYAAVRNVGLQNCWRSPSRWSTICRASRLSR
ncbi:RidA family protein [Salinisphaera sp. RV14]|uniref:RidA family protein n=1 Tax=Salinisphaera sp. RV14 TaxID=3454140 RepID=UPI003F85EA30